MDDKIFDQVHEVDLEKTMKESYIEYAMSVIASRALPDVRDGLNRRLQFRQCVADGHGHVCAGIAVRHGKYVQLIDRSAVVGNVVCS